MQRTDADRALFYLRAKRAGLIWTNEQMAIAFEIVSGLPRSVATPGMIVDRGAESDESMRCLAFCLIAESGLGGIFWPDADALALIAGWDEGRAAAALAAAKRGSIRLEAAL
jgi:hypothetical protein